MTRKIFACTSGCHGVAVDRDKNLIELGLWTFGDEPGDRSLWHRLRLAYDIVVRRKYYADSVCMDEETALALSQELRDAASACSNS